MKRSQITMSSAIAVLALVAINASVTASLISYRMDRGDAPSSRLEQGSIYRDPELMKREQERRLERLRTNQEQEELRSAAPDTDDSIEEDVRAHYRAWRHCTFRGYTRTRLHACVESVVNTGTYNIEF